MSTTELERRFHEAIHVLSGKEAHEALIGIARDAINLAKELENGNDQDTK